MKKTTFLTGILLSLSLGASAQTSRIDTIALVILDRMSDIIGDLNSVSFTVETEYDVVTDELGLVKNTSEEQVYMRGPDKMMVNSRGDKGHRSYWYDGQKLAYYSFDKNRYAQIDAPLTIMAAIDTVSKVYGVDFPAADFFYPSFSDDLLALAGNIVYLGTTQVKGKECFHIAGTAAGFTFQIWVNNDEFTLPAKMVIVYTNQQGNPQYEATYSNWNLNPVLPDAMFQFPEPPGARKAKLIPTTAGN